MPGEIIPIFAMLIPITALMIPIVAILTFHQRKMAQMMQQRQPLQSPQELADMRREMQELKQLVAQQTIQMDDFLSNQRKLATPPSVPDDIQSRINS